MSTPQEIELFEKLTQHFSAVASDVKLLTMAFDNHCREDKEWKDEDRVWKTSANPVLQMGRDFRTFGNVSKGIMYIIITIGAFVGVLYATINWLRR